MDKTNFSPKDELVYHADSPEEYCSHNVRKTARHISERVMHHMGRDTNSQILNTKIEKEYSCQKYENFKTLGWGFRNTRKIRKLSETL